MKNFFVKAVSPFLARQGLVVQEVVPKEKVIQLIKRLHPVQTQYELIRLGPKGDGGYLVPDCLDNILACFSPGVSVMSGFELDCLNLGMQVFMVDGSVDKPNWNISEDRYSFKKKFIGCTNNEEYKRAEFSTIINTSDELMNRFKVMVIEFHSLRHLWNKAFFRIIETVFNKILQTHICVHLHPNNFKGTKGSVITQFGLEIPSLMEMTFLRKDVAEIKGYQTLFPHSLDCDNTGKAHLPLPKGWYRTF